MDSQTPAPLRMDDVSSLNRSVATSIKIELARRDLVPADLARMAGWTKPYLSRRMNGDVPFNTDELDKIAFILNMSVTELTNPVQPRTAS